MTFEIPKAFIARVQKGITIPVSEIDRFLPEWTHDEQHRLLVLAFVNHLENRCRAIGKPCKMRIRENGRTIHVLTDEEAAGFTARRFRSRHRGMERDHRNKQEVDLANLSDEVKAKHLRDMHIQSRVLVAARIARRDPEFVPVVRSVPMIGQGYGLDLETCDA